MNAELTIDGKSVTTNDRDDVINPASGAPFASAPRATMAQVDEAVASAHRAFATFRKDVDARRGMLSKCASELNLRSKAIGEVLCKEQGKPLAQAIGEVRAAAAWFSFFATLPIDPPEVLDGGETKSIEVVRRPLGVVAAITPWNFPVALLAWKLAPALLAGNTVVAKPSPFTPLATLLTVEALREILPPGVLNVVTGGGDVGEALVVHPQVRKVSFTGSVATGKHIMRSASHGLKRLTLELGGNDAAIVLPDADPDRVAKPLFWNAFANSGQVCVAVKRLFVPSQLKAAIVERLAKLASDVKLGDGMEPGVQMGPINNAPQLARVTELVDEAKAKGAVVRSGGARLDRPGYFYPPTIVDDAKEGMRLVDEEQFGTALPILEYNDVSDAIARANATAFGLGASVWTSNAERGREVAAELEAGTVWVNQHNDLLPFAPFGGLKESGVGLENGRWGYNEFTAVTVVNAKR